MSSDLNAKANRVGSGAARGLGLGPFSRCSFRASSVRELRGRNAEEPKRRAELAAELARRAAMCCADLPVSSNADHPVLNKSRLFSSISGIAQRLLDLCSAGVAAAAEWASLRSFDWCPSASSLEEISVRRKLGIAVSLITDLTMDWQRKIWTAVRVDPTQGGFLPGSFLALVAAGRWLLPTVSRDEFDIFADLVDSRLSNVSYTENSWTYLESSLLQLVPSDALMEHLDRAEPAMLVRFFCAVAATALLHVRTLHTAMLVSWLTSTPKEDGHYLSRRDGHLLWRQSTAAFPAKFSELQLVTEFLGVPLRAAEPVTSTSRLPALQQFAFDSIGGLIVVELPTYLHQENAMAYADELRATIDILESSGFAGKLHILLLESWGIRNSPYLSRIFLWDWGGKITVEVVHQPHFSLHVRDAVVLEIMPSLSQLRCSQALFCWWLLLEDAIPENWDLQGYVAAAHAPEKPGCWYRLPTGCPNHSDLPAGSWKRDTWGDRISNHRMSLDACLRRRGEAFNTWCGVTDVEMHFVPSSTVDAEDSPQKRKHDSISTVLKRAAETVAAQPWGTQDVDQPFGVESFKHGCEKFTISCEYLIRHRVFSLHGRNLPSPTWPHLQNYQNIHNDGTRHVPAIIWACHPSLPCGGHGDRVKGIIAAFAFAILTNRHFYIDSPDPWDLRIFLQPNELDWRISGVQGYAHSRHVLWDHDVFENSYLDHLLDDDDPIWIVYTNKQSLIGPLFRHPKLMWNAEALGLTRMPYLAHRMWSILFKPTEALDRHFGRLRSELGGAHTPYIAMHHRMGDISSGFGVINGELDRRGGLAEVSALLSCAHMVEKRLGLANTTRWYLATDSAEALEVPQVATWRNSGKLITRGPGKRTHLAAAGVVPPTGFQKLTADAQEPGGHDAGPIKSARLPEVLQATASLAGVVDAWVDFLALSRSAASVVSSSAFGIMAAQIGGLENTFYVNGCIRLDMLA